MHKSLDRISEQRIHQRTLREKESQQRALQKNHRSISSKRTLQVFPPISLAQQDERNHWKNDWTPLFQIQLSFHERRLTASHSLAMEHRSNRTTGKLEIKASTKLRATKALKVENDLRTLTSQLMMWPSKFQLLSRLRPFCLTTSRQQLYPSQSSSQIPLNIKPCEVTILHWPQKFKIPSL